MISAPLAGHVLVVDDNLVNRKLLSQHLKQDGRTVETAEDGEEALLKLGAGSFDLVLLDLEMPRKDGLQTLIAMKQDVVLRHIPVIMITAVEEIESTIRCIEMGAEDYLPKPFNPILLRARIDASLEKKRLRDQEQLYLKGLERELDIGREIQMGFLPEELPQAEGWEIAAYLKAAREVAGDFYDAFLLPDGNIGLVIADVCDKGVGAALFMTLFRSLIRAAATTGVFGGSGAGASTPENRLRHTINLTNDYIANTHGNTGMFATVFFGILDPRDGRLTYINGGHEPPVIFHGAQLKASLAKTGPAIGAIAGLDFKSGQVQLEHGDLLFAFTDGVPETNNPGGEFFGRERLFDFLKDSAQGVQVLLNGIQAELHAHIADADQFDDITLLAVKRSK
jgi:phosphoserine phosphatase RsbU/P